MFLSDSPPGRMRASTTTISENLFRDLWEDEGERETMLTILQAECEVVPSRPGDYSPY